MQRKTHIARRAGGFEVLGTIRIPPSGVEFPLIGNVLLAATYALLLSKSVKD